MFLILIFKIAKSNLYDEKDLRDLLD